MSRATEPSGGPSSLIPAKDDYNSGYGNTLVSHTTCKIVSMNKRGRWQQQRSGRNEKENKAKEMMPTITSINVINDVRGGEGLEGWRALNRRM